MCLPPGEPVTPPTERGKELVNILQFILIFNIIISFLYIFISQDFFSMIFSLLACMILWQGYRTCNLCYIILYIFFTFSNLLDSFTYTGTIVQNFIGEQNFGEIIASSEFWVGLLCFIFYIVAIYYAFLAYREFKAIAFEQSGGYTGMQNFGFFSRSGNLQVPKTQYTSNSN